VRGEKEGGNHKEPIQGNVKGDGGGAIPLQQEKKGRCSAELRSEEEKPNELGDQLKNPLRFQSAAAKT